MTAQQLSQHPTDQQTQDAQYFRSVMLEMVDLGADLMRRAHRQAVSQTEAPAPEADQSPARTKTPAPDAFVTFERITRCIRLTIALSNKLSRPVAAPVAPRQTPGGQTPGGQTVRGKRKEWDGDPAKLTDAELAERIAACRAEREHDGNDRDNDDDLDRPVPDIIAGICRDLGIADIPATRVAKRRIVADLEAIAARAAMLRSPETNTSYDPPDPPAPKYRGAFYDDHRPAGSKATDPP
jgi:hypothetical protein